MSDQPPDLNPNGIIVGLCHAGMSADDVSDTRISEIGIRMASVTWQQTYSKRRENSFPVSYRETCCKKESRYELLQRHIVRKRQ